MGTRTGNTCVRTSSQPHPWRRRAGHVGRCGRLLRTCNGWCGVSSGRLRWALIGASTMAGGRFLAALQAEDQEVVSIYSSSAERAATFASKHGLERATDDLGTALDGVDAAYVSSKNDRRADQVIRATAFGKHVFCEKPLALSLSDGEAMLAAARSAGLVLAVNFHLRNAATVQAIRTAVEEGSLGEVVSARAQHALGPAAAASGWRLDEPEAGGGVILDLCSHTADALRFVLGRDTLDVSAIARGRDVQGGRAEDVVVTTQRMSGEVMVSTYESCAAPFAGTALEVHGTKASLVGRSLLSVNEAVGDVSIRDDNGVRLLAREVPENLYRRGIRAFVNAIAGKGVPVASGEDGLRALAVALAIQEAVASGRRVPVTYSVASI
jgi:1,5-anhydro-D-fructose reductase (1,5-anhydro-D-mannitol-forming)